ncbi:putative methyl-accepting chemotaxis protein [Pseudomonas sp. StFLB209]|nr:putative methyl-accepting chemotaxis protein [Pseudomonas sp. StFLB209]
MTGWAKHRSDRNLSSTSRRVVQATGLVLLLVSFGQGAAMAAEPPEVLLYRYVDSRGITVMDRQGVPPEYAGKGYQVLNAQGRVVQVVPPAPSAEQIRQAEAAKAQAGADAQLLRQYRSVDDVERAKARKLAEIDALIGVAQGNTQGLAAQQASLQGQAADLERAGRAVPQNLIDQMNDLRDQHNALKAEISRYQQARQQAESDFAQLRVRVSSLLQ